MYPFQPSISFSPSFFLFFFQNESRRDSGKGGDCQATNPSVDGGRRDRGRSSQVRSGSSVGGDGRSDRSNWDSLLDPSIGGYGGDNIRVEITYNSITILTHIRVVEIWMKRTFLCL